MLKFISIERLTYLLIFLFPIFGMLVRGWLTSIFNFLFLLGLFYLGKRKLEISREERFFLIIPVLYVGIFIVSSLANGWGDMQTRYFGSEIRFLLIIPIYLLVREHAECTKWLLLGAIFAAGVVFIQSIYEVQFQHASYANGVYSKIIFGPYSALLALWIIFLWKSNAKYSRKIIIAITFSLAIIATMESGSRGAYIGIIAILFAGLLIFFRAKGYLVLAMIMISIISLAYVKSQIVNTGVNNAIVQFEEYFSNRNAAKVKDIDTSVGTRLEMWRAARYFFPDHPVLGVGPGNYKSVAKSYAEAGKVDNEIASHGHPHNAYLEALYSKGILGLVLLLLLLYYPAYLLLKSINVSRNTAALGLLHIIGISAFSLTDASPILMNNYISVLLLGIAVFLSNHLNQVNSKKNNMMLIGK